MKRFLQSFQSLSPLFRTSGNDEREAQKLIDGIRIAKPCPVSWESMQGDERVRYCGSCKLNVYNISEMSSIEAVDLIREKEGRVCIQIYQRQDGTVITKDCPVGLKNLSRKFLKLAASIASLIGIVGSGTAASAQGPGRSDDTPATSNSSQSTKQAGRSCFKQPGEQPMMLRGEAMAPSVAPIVNKAAPKPEPSLKNPKRPLLCGTRQLHERKKNESKKLANALLAIAALGLTLASFKLLKRKKMMWVMGVALAMIFTLIGLAWF